MEKRETPGSIARQHGVPPMNIYKVMQEMKLGVQAMGAELNRAQAEKLHTYYKNTTKHRAAEAARQSALRSAFQRPALPADEPKVQNFPKRCGCCDARWVLTAIEDRREPWCPDCKHHAPREDDGLVEQVGRAEDHAAHYRERMTLYGASAEEAHQYKRKAYDSRMKWSRALAEVVLEHEPDDEGNCWCGGSYPCRTWRTLERSSRGLHKQLEDWGAMPDDQRERVLYGDDYNRMLDREQMEIERRAQAIADRRAGIDEDLAYPPRPSQTPPATPRRADPA